MPASRTPEGDSAKCEVCGAISYVLLSDPPRDSVCPSCGSYLQQFGSAYGDQNLKKTIYKFLSELQDIARDDQQRSSFPRHVTRNLTFCLAAYGASLWMFDGENIKLLDSYGEEPDIDHVQFVRKQGCASSCQNLSETRLILGIPMTHSGRLIGAVQVVQRNVESQTIQMGYRRFIQQVTGLASYGVAQLCQ